MLSCSFPYNWKSGVPASQLFPRCYTRCRIVLSNGSRKRLSGTSKRISRGRILSLKRVSYLPPSLVFVSLIIEISCAALFFDRKVLRHLILFFSEIKLIILTGRIFVFSLTLRGLDECGNMAYSLVDFCQSNKLYFVI